MATIRDVLCNPESTFVAVRQEFNTSGCVTVVRDVFRVVRKHKAKLSATWETAGVYRAQLFAILFGLIVLPIRRAHPKIKTLILCLQSHGQMKHKEKGTLRDVLQREDGCVRFAAFFLSELRSQGRDYKGLEILLDGFAQNDSVYCYKNGTLTVDRRTSQLGVCWAREIMTQPQQHHPALIEVSDYYKVLALLAVYESRQIDACSSVTLAVPVKTPTYPHGELGLIKYKFWDYVDVAVAYALLTQEVGSKLHSPYSDYCALLMPVLLMCHFLQNIPGRKVVHFSEIVQVFDILVNSGHCKNLFHVKQVDSGLTFDVGADEFVRLSVAVIGTRGNWNLDKMLTDICRTLTKLYTWRV
jgi:hypothetical protein